MTITIIIITIHCYITIIIIIYTGYIDWRLASCYTAYRSKKREGAGGANAPHKCLRGHGQPKISGKER